MVAHELISYAGWDRCVRLSNGEVELIVTVDVGPRVIRFGFIGGENEFVEYPEQVGKTGGDQYRSYGGHRLWVAPEEKPRTYYPDNRPVSWERKGGALVLSAPVETTTSLQKELEIWLDEAVNTVHIIHRISNRGESATSLSAWALSVMKAGGTAILPQAQFRPHPEALLPARTMALWSYTDMSDPRWKWGAKTIELRQDSGAKNPQKVGCLNLEGWVAYINQGNLFVKTVPHTPGATYPDMGCNTEIFTNARMLELETLSPVTELAPGEQLRHDEHWMLFRGVGHYEAVDVINGRARR